MGAGSAGRTVVCFAPLARERTAGLNEALISVRRWFRVAEASGMPEQAPEDTKPVDDRTKQEVQEDEEELYSIKNFSL